VLVGADLLVLLTNTNGVYTADPSSNPQAQLIGEVSDFAVLEQYEITQKTSTMGSGGMRSKVVAADMATAAGIATVICNGARAGALERVLAGEPEGTRFVPREVRHSSFKLWLKYAKPSRGTVAVDAGAARVLQEEGTSLLPVGVAGVEGDFGVGDAVEVAHGEEVIGKGICNYSAVELRRIKGMQSSQVRDVFPRAAQEAIHRDYFVLA